MRTTLTTANVEDVSLLELDPKLERVEVWDTELPGFGLKIRNGKKGLSRIWIVNPTNPVSIGKYPHKNLIVARAEAQRMLRDQEENGIDVRAHAKAKEDAKTAAEDARGGEFGEVASAFLIHFEGMVKTDKRRDSTLNAHRRYLTGPYFAGLHNKRLNEITAKMAAVALDAIAEQSKIVASAARGTAKALYRFAHWKGEAETGYNPFAPTENPAPRDKKAKSKGRPIADDELAIIWRATADGTGQVDDYGNIVRLAILLGVRVSEIAGIKRSEVDWKAGVWSLPGARHKVHTGYAIPLSAAALKILTDAAAKSKREFLFGTRSPHGFAISGHWGKRLKDRLERPIPYFRPHHDFRHTFRTGLTGKCGISAEIAELAIGHVKKDDPEGYDHNAHLAEKRVAFEAWAKHIARLVGPKLELVANA